MPTCTKHGIWSPPGRICNFCNQENIAAWKQSEKEKKQVATKFQKALQRKIKPKPVIYIPGVLVAKPLIMDRTKLKNELQRQWRKKIFPFYDKKGLTNRCWIDPNHKFFKKMKGQLYSAQVSHYYAKSHIYQLWTHKVNSGICCYHCNVDKPHIVAAMAPMMIQVWGDKLFAELECEMEVHLDSINKGMDDEGNLVTKQPSTTWLLDEIEKVKNMTIS